MEGLYDMGDAVLADPQRQKQLPVGGVHLNQAFNKFLDMVTFEGGVPLRPVEFPSWNHVPIMSTDDGPKLVDALMASPGIQRYPWHELEYDFLIATAKQTKV